jgi:hypothetical protein
VIARTLRGLAAAATLAALLAGWPAALLAAGRAAAPWLPALADPAGLLARPDPGGLFLLLVLALGWAAWAVWTAAVLVEAAAQVRGVPTPRLGGLFPQTAAAALVTAVAVAFATPAGPALAAPGSSPPAATAAVVVLGTAAPLAAADGANEAVTEGTAAQEPAGQDGALRAYTVEPGDTLWGIAEEQLHDPYRWPQIADASDDLPQPDGRHLADPDLILPGWTLHLPDTRAAQAAPTPPPAPTPTPPGDQADPATPEPATVAEPPALPRTPLQSSAAPSAPDSPAADGSSVPDPSASDPSAPGPVEPTARPGEVLGLPATPLAHGRTGAGGPAAGAGPVAAPLDHEGRANPAHGVLGLPDWIDDPLTPTRAEDAPDLAAAARGPLR